MQYSLVNKSHCLIVGAILALSSVAAEAVPNTVVVYLRAGSLPISVVGEQITLKFSEDGLLQTAVTRTSDKVRRMDIQRIGDTFIVLHSGAEERRYNSVVRGTIDGDTATLTMIGLRGENIEVAISKTTSFSDKASSVFNVTYDSRPTLIFAVSQEGVRVTYLNSRRSFSYSLEDSTGRPKLESNIHEGQYTYSIAGGITTVEYRSQEGMLLRSLQIEGPIARWNPLIAIVNFELVDDGIIGIPILPYIGGAPPDASES